MPAPPEKAPEKTPEKAPKKAPDLGLDGPAAPALIEVVGRAQLAVTVGAELRIYDADRRGLTLASHFPLPARHPVPDELELGAAPLSLVWRTSDELVALFGDGALARVTRGVMTPLARPAASFFRVSRAVLARHAEDVPRDLRARDKGLIVTPEGELWIDHCAWFGCGDEQCVCEYGVYVRTGARPRQSHEAPVARPWPTLAAPSGWSLDRAILKNDADDLGFGRLTCTAPGRASWVNQRESLNDFGVQAMGWVSQRPPIAWLDQAVGGFDSLSVQRCLLGGCGVLECLQSNYDAGLELARGPDGFWARVMPDDAGVEVLWHGRVLGRIDGARQAVFAPAAVAQATPSVSCLVHPGLFFPASAPMVISREAAAKLADEGTVAEFEARLAKDGALFVRGEDAVIVKRTDGTLVRVALVGMVGPTSDFMLLEDSPFEAGGDTLSQYGGVVSSNPLIVGVTTELSAPDVDRYVGGSMIQHVIDPETGRVVAALRCETGNGSLPTWTGGERLQVTGCDPDAERFAITRADLWSCATDPKDRVGAAQAWVRLGRSLTTREPGQAVRAMRTAIRALDARDAKAARRVPEAWSGLGYALLVLGQAGTGQSGRETLRDSVRYLHMALALSNDAAFRSKVLLNEGDADVRLAQLETDRDRAHEALDAAIKAYEQALAAVPSDLVRKRLIDAKTARAKP